MEGFPCYFSEFKEAGAKLGLHTDSVGLIDFYESLAIFPRVNAALYQTLDELLHVNKPENGLAVSALEMELFKEARLLIKQLRHGDECDYKGQALLEEDFFLANSDKLIFAMKEFKADLATENLYKRANPLLVSKLDITVSPQAPLTS